MTEVVDILFGIIHAALSNPTDAPIQYRFISEAPGLRQRTDVMMSEFAGALGPA